MRLINLFNTYYRSSSLLVICSLTTLLVTAQQRTDTARLQKEEEFFPIKTIPIPESVKLEVGGMTLLPDDALAVSTRRGEVWKISNPYMKNGMAPKYKLFAEGLHEALGLNFINGELYSTQRSEITRLRDLDGDGEADEYKTFYTWPLSGNYHEYAYGPIVDKQGNLVVTLNLAWRNMGESLSRWHGWMLKIDSNGKMKPFAAGFRSPAGFGTNSAGDIFYAENQGDWVGSGGITHVTEGSFMGNPASLVWSDLPGSPVKLHQSDIPSTNEPKFEVAKRIPGLTPPTVWFPHSILGVSTSGILNYGAEGKMGPFQDQLFVGDQGQSKIMRVNLEKVKGVYQGAVFLFREGFSSGILRMIWGSDGSMFVGMTARGWGSTGGEDHGLQQLSWNGKMPFEIKTMNAKPDGFELEFTKPVDKAAAKDAASYKLTSFIYQYHRDYGSPVINQGNCAIRAIEVSDDGLHVRIVADSLKEGYIHELKAEGVRSADNYLLLHNTGYYTLNRIPDGDKLTITASNRIMPPMNHHMMEPTPGTGKPIAKATTKPKEPAGKHITRQPASWVKGADYAFTVTPIPNLKYSVALLTVKPGSKIKLTFNNSDDMLHNMVFTAPGAADQVGEMALKLGLNGEVMNYVPNSPKVLFYTRLLQPKTAETIYITAPDKPGDYPFVCTYPGHYVSMRGVLRVVGK